MQQALANCEAILRAAGASLDDVVDVLVLLARPADFAGLNEAYAKFFPRRLRALSRSWALKFRTCWCRSR